MPDESKVTILVVEDDPVCRRLAMRQLSNLGFTAPCAVNGKEAIEQLSANSCSLVLMDLQMPVMGGIETTKAIREVERTKHQPRIPIVGVSANPDRDICLKAGMDDFLFKPASLDELREVLNRWLPEKAESASNNSKDMY